MVLLGMQIPSSCLLYSCPCFLRIPYIAFCKSSMLKACRPACRCFPGAWQVHFIWPNGKGALLTGIEKERPSYERLLSALQGIPGSKASRSWVDRVNPFSGVCHAVQLTPV